MFVFCDFDSSLLVGHESAINNCISLLTVWTHELADAGKVFEFEFEYYLHCYVCGVNEEMRFEFLDLGVDKEEVIKAIDVRTCFSTLIGVIP
jgi:hypothetical protein